MENNSHVSDQTMNRSDPLVLTAGLLCLEKRVSYRRLSYLFSFDGETLASVSHELIIKRIAVEINGEGLALRADFSTHADNFNALATEKSTAEVPSHSETIRSNAPTLSQSTAERRQLTVMFCDMANSTRLSTQLDPEDLREVLLDYQDLCRTAIKKYNGFIARYMGDGILVYFGYPKAHENDAETAVRAGLHILESVASSSTGNRDIAVRIGVATGPVVVGDLIGEGAAEEAAVVGETPNFAARLQSLAKPGQIMLSDLTMRLIGNTFTPLDAGLHTVKGIDTPVQVWSVSGESEHTSPVGQHNSLPLVGRAQELEILMSCWQRARNGNGTVLLIKAEAGHGKSRLLRALHDEVQSRDNPIVYLRASAYHTATSLYPIIDFLKNTIDWRRADSDEQRLSRMYELTEPYLNDHPHAKQLLAQLLTLPLEDNQTVTDLSPQELREGTLDFLRDWLSDSQAQNATMIVWEDLHWADSTTVELFVLMQQQPEERKVLCVGTHRPEFKLPEKSSLSLTTIGLNRLPESDIQTIAKNLAGDKPIPDSMLKHIAEKSDGVPLFAEELTHGILDANLENTFEDAKSLSMDMRIPETLQDSLMARLDIVPVQKEIAQIGSVLGREFSFEHICAIAPHDNKTVDKALLELVDRSLLYRPDQQANASFIFKHALIRDTAYHSLLRKTDATITNGQLKYTSANLASPVTDSPNFSHITCQRVANIRAKRCKPGRSPPVRHSLARRMQKP